jgi:hypothetical protein
MQARREEIMTDNHNAAEHLRSAALHHQRAGQFHREASRHYQIGKDYAHAAHQALIARGHALQASDHEDDAGAYFSEHNGNVLRKHSEPVLGLPAKSLEAPEATQANLSGAEHHAAAADHHDLAARHHGEASKHYDAKEYALAAREVEIAHGHTQRSVFHGDEAAKHHVEHFGKSGPTAEIS